MRLILIIIVLAIADGALHLALNYVLFAGNMFGPLPFPSPFPLPLNQLFTLNFVGYVALALALWFWPRFLKSGQWLVDLALILFSAASILGWVQIGMPNPEGLGYISKTLEVALIVAAAAHASLDMRRAGAN